MATSNHDSVANLNPPQTARMIGEQVGTPQLTEDEQKQLLHKVRRNLLIASVGFILGCVAVVIGVAFIFWPAALILGGLAVAAGCGWLIDVPDIGPTPMKRG